MTPGELAGIISGGLSALVSVGTLAKYMVTHGADREKLSANSAWIKDHGVERSELHSLAQRVEKAEDDCIPRREFDAMGARLDRVEGEVTEVSRTMNDIRVEVARIPTQIEAQNKLMEVRFETLGHQMKNLRQALESVYRLPSDPQS